MPLYWNDLYFWYTFHYLYLILWLRNGKIVVKGVDFLVLLHLYRSFLTECLFYSLQFNKDALLETYTSYIKNYLNAREAVRTAMLAKVAFKSFIEVSCVTFFHYSYVQFPKPI